MLESSDIGEGGASITMEKHHMWKFLFGDGIDLMHVLIAKDSDIPELDIVSNFKLWQGKSLLINLNELLSHDGMVLEVKQRQINLLSFLLHADLLI